MVRLGKDFTNIHPFLPKGESHWSRFDTFFKYTNEKLVTGYEHSFSKSIVESSTVIQDTQ